MPSTHCIMHVIRDRNVLGKKCLKCNIMRLAWARFIRLVVALLFFVVRPNFCINFELMSRNVEFVRLLHDAGVRLQHAVVESAIVADVVYRPPNNTVELVCTGTLARGATAIRCQMISIWFAAAPSISYSYDEQWTVVLLYGFDIWRWLPDLPTCLFNSWQIVLLTGA